MTSPLVRLGVNEESGVNRTYLDDDLDRAALANRNAEILLANGVAPEVVRTMLPTARLPGEQRTGEQRARIAAATRRRWADPAYAKRVAAGVRAAAKARANTGAHPQSAATRAKIANSMRARWRSPEYRASRATSYRTG